MNGQPFNKSDEGVVNFLRPIFYVLLLMGLTLNSVNLSAQTASPQAQDQVQTDTPTPPAEPAVKAEAPVTLAPQETVQTLDLNDPAIQEAIKAKESADQALVDAVLKARDSAAKAQPAAIEDTGVKAPSIIPKNAEDAKALGKKILDKIIGWLTSPSFLAQIGAIALVWFLAPILTKVTTKRVFLFRDPPADDAKMRTAREYLYRSRDFLRAIFQVALLALFAVILKAVPILGQDWLVKIAQGLAVVFLLYTVIKTFITNDMLQKLAIWILIPLALLIVFGYYDDLTDWLKSIKLGQGEEAMSAMTIVLLAIFGAIFFKLATYSNSRGQDAIRAQESLDATTRAVISKILQIIIFTAAVIMAFSAAGISLSGLVVVFSALSLGIGLGLQPVAANFVSGMIILFDRSVRVGDYVVLADGQEGFVEAINMRSTTVETTDGKDIMVPNTTFIENSYENWTHKDPRQRYEVYFTVDFDTDIDMLEDIIIPAVSAHPSVLQEPEEPDLELREFGDNGIKFAVEFWCSGIDDGPNKFTSDLNFIIWRTLRDNKIKIPFPQRVVHMQK